MLDGKTGHEPHMGSLLFKCIGDVGISLARNVSREQSVKQSHLLGVKVCLTKKLNGWLKLERQKEHRNGCYWV